MRKPSKIFFGWWTAIASGIINLWGMGYYMYGISALFKPIAVELGFTRAVTSIPAAIARLEGVFETPLAGWLTDKYGPRWVTFVGVFLIGLGLVGMSYINSVWSYYIVWGIVVGTGINIAMFVPMETAIANWFVKKRGVAQGIKAILSGLSGVLAFPLIVLLITKVGWRQTCFIGGLVMWVVGLPLAWFFLKRHRPEYYGLLPDGATVDKRSNDTGQMIVRGVEYAAELEEVEFTFIQAIGTPACWLLISAQAIQGFAWTAFQLHTIPFLTDMGIDPLAAAGMAVVYVAVSLPFRFLGGVLADRAGRQNLRLLLGGSYFLQAVSFIVFLINPIPAMVYVWFVLLGIGWGVSFTIYPVINGRYFGRKAFGSIRGIGQAIMAPLSIVSAIGAGWIYDTTGSYTSAFVLFAAALVAAAIIASMAKPPEPPTKSLISAASHNSMVK